MTESDQTMNRRQTGRIGLLCVAGLVVALLIILFRQINTLQVQLEQINGRSLEHAFWQVCDAQASPSTRTECFLRLVSAGHSNWSSARLNNLQLADCNLNRVSLTYAHFDSCQMTNLKLNNSDLRGSKFEVCELARAEFRDADARESSFFKADLTKADFRGARVMSASFEQAMMNEAVLVAAKLDDGFLPMATLDGADLTGANLTDCVLEATSLRNCTLSLTNFKNADITDADFTGSNWWRARGLSTEQQQQLLLDFAPAKDPADSRSRDFELWLKTLETR